MRNTWKRNKAQGILEYAVFIAVIVAALVGMQIYIKRGMQGRLRQAADEMGQQYSPKNTVGNAVVTSDSNSTTQVNIAFKSEADLGLDLDKDGTIENDVYGSLAETDSTLNSATTTTTGSETVGALESSLF